MSACCRSNNNLTKLDLSLWATSCNRSVAKTSAQAILSTRRMKRVLVVDDQSDCSEPMARLLKLCGFDAQTAGNGREALDKLNYWSADLVLLDLIMPIMDGFAFLEAIRGQPRWSDLPVIVFSAWDNET